MIDILIKNMEYTFFVKTTIKMYEMSTVLTYAIASIRRNVLTGERYNLSNSLKNISSVVHYDNFAYCSIISFR